MSQADESGSLAKPIATAACLITRNTSGVAVYHGESKTFADIFWMEDLKSFPCRKFEL